MARVWYFPAFFLDLPIVSLYKLVPVTSYSVYLDPGSDSQGERPSWVGLPWVGCLWVAFSSPVSQLTNHANGFLISGLIGIMARSSNHIALIIFYRLLCACSTKLRWCLAAGKFPSRIPNHMKAACASLEVNSVPLSTSFAYFYFTHEWKKTTVTVEGCQQIFGQ